MQTIAPTNPVRLLIEQALLARRIEASGAGIHWAPQRTAESARAIVDTALSNASLKTNARGFALKYQGHSMNSAVAEIAEAILARAAG
ncbi:hypothetical protein [Ralstonia solanacearum]|uniref:hypothetical protein n=1 Tax=Ralstonia solanacearum TaxID=305 RepID=UPI0001816659|nr:hypothetical protein [Ralstonia solanacearum]MDC6177177.1 hypothetical protein [Ralstonia solanacearum]MDC6210264.1 hypothetical protein [Ralstonia solanacearum]MDC6241713.1 hypothetical protein [Ralstonia solanacearum]MDD7799630.1 hypothetical protein [Ralstonia solanacearum]